MATWIDPVTPRRITARFGDSGPHWTNRHTGLDFDGQTGDKVVAVANGRVIFAGWNGSAYGNTVKVSHGGGLETWYAHLSTVSVFPVLSVRQGQQVGTMGATGNVTGSHLHLEVRENGVPQNPDRYLGTEPNVSGSDGGGAVTSGGDITAQLSEGFGRIGLFVGGVVVLLIGGYLFYKNRRTLL